MVRRREKPQGCIRVLLSRRVGVPVSIDQGQHSLYECPHDRPVVIVIIVFYEIVIVIGVEFLGCYESGDNRRVTRHFRELADRNLEVSVLRESPASLLSHRHHCVRRRAPQLLRRLEIVTQP